MELTSDPSADIGEGKSNKTEKGVSHRMKWEIAATLAACIGIFVIASTVLPTEKWLAFIVEHQEYPLEELFIVPIALSVALVIISGRRWRELHREALKSSRLVEQLRQGTRIDGELSQMTNLLQSCFTPEEASKIISHYGRLLLPGTAGSLYVFRSSRNLMELVADWNEPDGREPSILPQQCWGLRQGQIYEVQDPAERIICSHVPQPGPYACLPMMAHGEVLALLFVQPKERSAVTPAFRDASRTILRVFAQHLSLAVSNLNLRITLRQQSIRDPLTGLFNRRYLEETLVIEAERSKRSNEPFGIIMVDLDHFKRFNDAHGHDAGDFILQALGRYFQRNVRGGDIACRYGGEEFTLILPGANLSATLKRAEQLCEGVRSLRVELKGQALGPLTLSMGVATYPDQGDNAEAVIQAADSALYQAKREGRDRVVTASAGRALTTRSSPETADSRA